MPREHHVVQDPPYGAPPVRWGDGVTRIKLLLVDDEEDFVTSTAERLELRDYCAEVALSGTQALEKVEVDVPDVIVLDLKMPGIDGLEVLRHVKSIHPHVEVIILTGHGSDRNEETARRLGAFEYLRKPIGIERLVDAVQRATRCSTAEPGDHGDHGDTVRPECP